MSKKQKLIKKLYSKPKDFTFKELETILKSLGFEQVKTNAGSHFKWHHSEKNIKYGAPRNQPVKRCYLKELINMIETHFPNYD